MRSRSITNSSVTTARSPRASSRSGTGESGTRRRASRPRCPVAGPMAGPEPRPAAPAAVLLADHGARRGHPVAQRCRDAQRAADPGELCPAQRARRAVRPAGAGRDLLLQRQRARHLLLRAVRADGRGEGACAPAPPGKRCGSSTSTPIPARRSTGRACAATTAAVLCPPSLAEQWQSELCTKFNLDAELVLPGTVTRLERGLEYGQSLFERTTRTPSSASVDPLRSSLSCWPILLRTVAGSCASA